MVCLRHSVPAWQLQAKECLLRYSATSLHVPVKLLKETYRLQGPMQEVRTALESKPGEYPGNQDAVKALIESGELVPYDSILAEGSSLCPVLVRRRNEEAKAGAFAYVEYG
jgi:hypothetical protein